MIIAALASGSQLFTDKLDKDAKANVSAAVELSNATGWTHVRSGGLSIASCFTIAPFELAGRLALRALPASAIVRRIAVEIYAQGSARQRATAQSQATGEGTY
jgi:hypothetical protein